MSKAILVINAVNRCADCPLRVGIAKKGDIVTFCPLTMKTTNNSEYYENKPDWCPLKPIPQKKEEHLAMPLELRNHIKGYNACIDEILKGSGSR